MKLLRRIEIVAKISNFLVCGSRSHYLTIRMVHQKPKEVTIKVPWGHISGLHWNESTSLSPFVCLHGWKDNAASFNRIIPTILDRTSHYQFLAIDLPGHGFSSHYPPGMLYQLVDHLIAIHRVVKHFGWSENEGMHLMGHSLGAILSFLFAASHSELVDCVIAIDALVPVIFNQADLVSMLKIITEGYLKMECKSKNPNATFEQIRQKILKSHMGIDELTCDILLTRAIAETSPNSGEWMFTHDPRVNFLPLMCISADQIENFAKSFRSKLLFTKADNGVNYLSDYMEPNMQKWLATNNKKHIRFVRAEDANHHVHLLEPEKIAPDILKFLKDTH